MNKYEAMYIVTPEMEDEAIKGVIEKFSGIITANGGEIDAEIDDHGITIVLRDQGPGIPDVEKAMQEGWSTASDEIRAQGFGAGMGLPNMKKYTDNMQIDTVLGVGTTISLRVDLH